jgi:hypothetical protein
MWSSLKPKCIAFSDMEGVGGGNTKLKKSKHNWWIRKQWTNG